MKGSCWGRGGGVEKAGRELGERVSCFEGDVKRFFLGDFFGYLSFADPDPVLTSLASGLGRGGRCLLFPNDAMF